MFQIGYTIFNLSANRFESTTRHHGSRPTIKVSGPSAGFVRVLDSASPVALTTGEAFSSSLLCCVQSRCRPANGGPAYENIAAHSAPIDRTHRVRVKEIDRLPVRGFSFIESASRPAQPRQRCVKKSQRIGISTKIHTTICEGLHHVIGGKSDFRKRLENLSAKFRKAGSRCKGILVSKALKARERLLKLSDPSIDVFPLNLKLLNLLNRSLIT